MHLLPGIHRVPGYTGAYLPRRDAADEVEFVTICQFDDIDAVRRFDSLRRPEHTARRCVAEYHSRSDASGGAMLGMLIGSAVTNRCVVTATVRAA